MAATPDRPNIVFILTDDQGPWALGCSGNPEIRTPNLDRLARRGVYFENFFCTSPVCSPARASIMTGRIPSQHGVHDWIRGGNMPPDTARYLEGQTCYTDILAANGYTVGLSGKWHLGDSLAPQHGFSHWFTTPIGSSPYNDPTMIRNGQTQEHTGYITDIITDDAIAFVNENREGPFYLSLHYTAPHSPWEGHPQDIVDSYDDCPFESCPQEPQHPYARAGLLPHLGNRESLKQYFAAVTAMDANVGRLMDALDEAGLRENTLVIFMADNGFSCGHHGYWGKGNGTLPMNMYENSVKVPAIVSHPGRVVEGVTSSAMVNQYDVFPTLLEYLGLPPAKDDTMPGVSFLPVLTGKADEVRENVVIYEEYGPVRMIRTREWKYIHRYPYGPHELYDLANDPGERRNLIDDESQQARIAEMRKNLTDWFARYVVPERDGARMPVAGDGQKTPIGEGRPGAEAFYPPFRPMADPWRDGGGGSG